MPVLFAAARQLLIVICVAMMISVALPKFAVAHVEILPKQVSPGDYSNLIFFVYHGCETASTVGITVRVPEGVAVARPNMKAGWKITTESARYPKPVDVYGQKYEEGFVVLSWAGGSVPSEYMDSFVMSVFFPDQPGKTFRFLVEQRCQGVPESLSFVQEVTVRGPSGPPAGPASAANAAAAPVSGPAATDDSLSSPSSQLLSTLAVVIAILAFAMTLRRRL